MCSFARVSFVVSSTALTCFGRPYDAVTRRNGYCVGNVTWELLRWVPGCLQQINVFILYQHAMLKEIHIMQIMKLIAGITKFTVRIEISKFIMLV